MLGIARDVAFYPPVDLTVLHTLLPVKLLRHRKRHSKSNSLFAPPIRHKWFRHHHNVLLLQTGHCVLHVLCEVQNNRTLIQCCINSPGIKTTKREASNRLFLWCQVLYVIQLDRTLSVRLIQRCYVEK
jgi:hypothetical protein